MTIDKWGRRVIVGACWAVLNYGSVYLQPLLNTDVKTVRLLVETSGWVAAVIVLGLSGTDAAKNLLESRKENDRTVASK